MVARPCDLASYVNFFPSVLSHNVVQATRSVLPSADHTIMSPLDVVTVYLPVFVIFVGALSCGAMFLYMLHVLSMSLARHNPTRSHCVMRVVRCSVISSYSHKSIIETCSPLTYYVTRNAMAYLFQSDMHVLPWLSDPMILQGCDPITFEPTTFSAVVEASGAMTTSSSK